MALIQLAPAAGSACLVGGLVAAGVAAQVAGLWLHRSLVRYAGALAVGAAALLDRDAVLGAGQVLALLALRDTKS